MTNEQQTQGTAADAVGAPVEQPVRRLACSVPPELRYPLRELVALKIELDRYVERSKVPPCMDCGAETPEQAETMCNCGGDKDDCHGSRLWY